MALNVSELEKALAGPMVTAEVLKRTEEVAEYWRSLTQGVFEHQKEHTLKSGYVEEPGDYERSIRAKTIRRKDGSIKGRVESTDYKAHWIEYGSSKMPTYAFAEKTRSHFTNG
ncbi:hypothetical protein EF294_03470 [Gordonia oryzae]|uniref:HK97 gp10 family phage protein n=1 Tax=Gordonia oryzae TaxID=2487349 RepID=A0A3N4GS58_9ACTN|nr:hypothetical protein [Gordonia oryzae]RPA65809.1 hypothetical protein EF294_03470 [Gordonia oryzae]